MPTEMRTIMRIPSLAWVLCLVLFALAGVPAGAQVLDPRLRCEVASYYLVAEPSDVTVKVAIWGTVRYPGLYEVPVNTPMTKLFSLAGGPEIDTRFTSDSRRVLVRLTRTDGVSRQVIYKSTMTNDIAVSQDDPLLLDGDVLTVETVMRRHITWRDAFPVVAAIASVALAVERVSNPR